ncbi:MAG: hypothetical protein WDM89_08635 [Rhizomicrobium sp.]
MSVIRRHRRTFVRIPALDGVYGTIILTPLSGPYDPKTALVAEFQEQEATGGKVIGEATQKFGGANRLHAQLRDIEPRRCALSRAICGERGRTMAVQVTMEYASPRDEALKQDFLNAVYDEALHKLGGVK